MKQFSIVTITLVRIISLSISVMFLVACSTASNQELDLIPGTNESVTVQTKTAVPSRNPYEELFEEAQLNGDVAVIVELDLSHWIENSSESVSYDKAIPIAREAVIRELQSPEVEAVVYQVFHTNPYLAIRVNEEGLLVLLDSKFVKTLKPDQASGLP